MADLQVTLAFLLENQAEVARELERTGGIAGADFGKGLSAGAKKSLDDLIDQATKAAKQVGLVFNKQKFQFETIRGEIVPPEVLKKLSSLNKNLDEARIAVDTFKSSISQASRQSVQDFSLIESAITGVAISLSNRLTDASLSALGSIRGLVGGFIELDSELRLASAAAGEQGGYQRLSTVVSKVGIEAAGTTKEVAQLATSLVQAGFSVKEVEAALPGIVRGAEATGTGFEEFGSIIADTLRSFGLEASETGRVVDVMAKTVNSSNAQMEDLSYTFQYSASTAKAVGISMEELAAAAGLLANVGIRGSIAGTGLRTMIERLGRASGGASQDVLDLAWGQDRLAKAMVKVGASVIDANGNMLPLEDQLIKLKDGFNDLSQADQLQLSNILFGDEAGNKFLSMINQSTSSIRGMFAGIGDSQGSTDAARREMAGFGLELKQLQGTLDSVGNDAGQVAVSVLRPLLGIANQLAGTISGLPTPIKATAVVLTALGAAGLAASIGIAAIGLAVKNIGGFAALQDQIALVTSTITGPFAASTVVFLGVAAAVGLATGQFKNMDAVTKQVVITMISLSAAIGTAMLLANAQVIVSSIAGWSAVLLPVVASYRSLIAATKGLTASQIALNVAQAPLAGIAVVIAGITSAYAALRKGIGLAAAATAFLQSLTSPGLGAAKVAAAAIVGVAAYGALNLMIKEASQETSKLSEEQRALQSEIEETRKLISEQREMGLSTGYAQKRLAQLEVKKSAIAEPLEFSLDIDQAEKKIELLKKKMEESKDSTTKVTSEAQIEATGQWKRFLEVLKNNEDLSKLPAPLREYAEKLKEANDDIQKLQEKRLTIPIDATADNADINKRVSELQEYINDLTVDVRISIEKSTIEDQLKRVQKELDRIPTNESKDRTNLEKERDRLSVMLSKNKNEEIGQNQKTIAVAKEITATNETRIALIKTQQAEEESLLAQQQAAGSITESQLSRETSMIRLKAIELEKEIKLKQLSASIEDSGKNSASAIALRKDVADLNAEKARIRTDLSKQDRESFIARETAAIQLQKSSYQSLMAQRLADGKISKDAYDNELRYLEKVSLERERASKIYQLSNTNLSVQEDMGIRREIVDIDKSLAENRLATAEASRAKLEKELDLHSRILDLSSQNSQTATDTAKNGYALQLQYLEAIMENSKARQDLARSEFDVALAFQNRAISVAESQLAGMREALNNKPAKGTSKKEEEQLRALKLDAIARKEAEIAGMKERAAQLTIQAKQAEIDSLNEQERMEWLSLDLKQRMAVVDQESRFAASRFLNYQQALEWRRARAKAMDPNLSEEERKEYASIAKLQGEALDLSAKDVEFQYEKLGLIKEMNKIERDTLAMNQRSRRNKLYAELVSLGGARFAGGDVIPDKKYIINELGRESFLSDSGQLSWINQPANALWRPPSRGMVLPADVSTRLASAGMLPGGRTGAGGNHVERIAHGMGANGNVIAMIANHSVAIGRLQKSIDRLVTKDWSVTVPVASNARLLKTVGAF